MGPVLDPGRKQPNGKKIMELRKQKELKQQALATDAHISERTLRDIEKKNHPVPATTITAIAAVLEVNPSDITLSSPSSLPAPPKNQSLLKLKAIQSATELGTVASRADKYQWRLEVDPKAATASRMQAVLQIIDRLVQGLRTDSNGHRVAYDEFDGEQFGEIPRLARLQELLNELLTNEVAVLAGTYSFSRLRNVDEVDDFILPPVVFVNIPDKPRKVIYTSIILLIRFVPSLVNDVVVPVNTGVSAQDFDPAHIEVSDHFFPF